MQSCSKLKVLDLGNKSMTFAGTLAITGCANIEELHVPEGPTNVSSFLTGLSNVKILYVPASFTATSLSGFGLSSSSKLEEVHVAETSTRLSSSGGAVFNSAKTGFLLFHANCRGPITIPAEMTTLGTNFQNKANLIGVNLHNGVTGITAATFSGCNKLQYINVAEDHPTLESKNGALYNKGTGALIFNPIGSGDQYVVPDTVTAIGSDLVGRVNATKMVFHAGVTGLNADIFAGCVGLAEIVVLEGNPYFSSLNGVLYNANKTELIYCPMAKTGDYEIPASVIKIGNNAFKNSHLSKITFAAPTGTAQGLVIGSGQTATNVFAGSTITEIVFPSRLAVIGHTAFGGSATVTPAIQNITFQSEANGTGMLANIGPNAFAYCSNLTGTITIPLNMTSSSTVIGANAFAYCSNLAGITISKNVSSIGDGAFQGCTNLAFATIQTEEDGTSLLTVINPNVFRDCVSLAAINLPKTIVGTIGANAFKGCAFANLEIPAGVTAFGANAFNGCSMLEVLNISSIITDIPYTALIGCSNLREINVDAANPNYSSEDGILYDKQKTTLLKCPAKKEGGVLVQKTVTTIGDYAFQYCSELTYLIFVGNTTTFKQFAFQYCTLRDIIIAECVTTIDAHAFDGWTSAQAIAIIARTSAPISWDPDWRTNCSAEVLWQN